MRRANRSDARPLAAFAAEQFRITYQDDTPATDLEEHIRQNFGTEQQQAEIGDPASAVFIAISDDRVVGYAHVVAGEPDAKSAFLNRIYIHPDFKGHGLARALLAEVTRESRARGAMRLELTVFERNARAIAFYTKSGFTTIGTATFQVGDEQQSDHVMEIRLDGI
ncbi:MAG: GNAT family N-acetyltransferase [Rhizobiaceae bacterium]|nr:GNAT family N-acetyltransferase [Rhizobiaceae bacterium]